MSDYHVERRDYRKWIVMGLFAMAWLTVGAAIAIGTKNPDDVIRNLLWYLGLSSALGGIIAAAAFYG